jgi:hypothetical protein
MFCILDHETAGYTRTKEVRDVRKSMVQNGRVISPKLDEHFRYLSVPFKLNVMSFNREDATGGKGIKQARQVLGIHRIEVALNKFNLSF